MSDAPGTTPMTRHSNDDEWLSPFSDEALDLYHAKLLDDWGFTPRKRPVLKRNSLPQQRAKLRLGRRASDLQC
jgi:hypothetical protein